MRLVLIQKELFDLAKRIISGLWVIQVHADLVLKFITIMAIIYLVPHQEVMVMKATVL